jgi:hypothetical protein
MAGLICFSAVAEANDRKDLPLRPSPLAGKVWRGLQVAVVSRMQGRILFVAPSGQRVSGNALATARRITRAATGS